jgi:Holliday junction DNA helicase RuvA
MIAYIKGLLVEATPLQAIIDVHGVGYVLSIPVTTAEKLPATGSIVQLFTLAVYREDQQSLYGFITREDRDFFQLVVEKVSGIGPRTALSLLSRLSVESLLHAIQNGDLNLLSQCPGIGKKTAERLVIELRDKVAVFGHSPSVIAANGGSASNPTPIGQQNLFDAITALVTLGYKPADADKAARKALKELGAETPAELLIRAALK